MTIQWEETGSIGICFAEEGNCRLAAIHYIWSRDNLMVLDQIDLANPNAKPILRNLTHHIVENARLLESRIIPLCDPLMEIFEKTPAYRDVLYMKEKARGGLPFAGKPFRTRDLFN